MTSAFALPKQPPTPATEPRLKPDAALQTLDLSKDYGDGMGLTTELDLVIGTGELVDALVWITDQRDLAARTDKLLNDGLMSRTDVLRFVDQNMRIAADKGAQDAGLFCQGAVAPVAPEVVCIGTYLSKTMH